MDVDEISFEPGTHTITGMRQGAFRALRGATVNIGGTLQGALRIDEGATVLVTGSVQGAVAVTGELIVGEHGELQGAIQVDGWVDSAGLLAGVISNSGQVTNRGVRCALVDGRAVDDTEGGVIEVERPEPGGNLTLPNLSGWQRHRKLRD